MADYDANVLQQYADALYREAATIVFQTAWTYGGVLLLVSLVLIGTYAATVGQRSAGDNSTFYLIVVIAMTAIGVYAGVLAGRKKAFHLKLQAQQVLCQKQIEVNTRK